MSLLETIEKPKPRAPVITLFADAGVGKTRAAATFPNCLFIRAEDGMQSIPADEKPDAFPIVENSTQLFDQLMALIKEDHDYSTLVIDSVSALETMFGKEVVDADEKNNLAKAGGGYGGGYQLVANMHARVRKAAAILNEKKHMAIVFLSHAETVKVSPPDMEDYTQYSLRLNEKYSQKFYIDDVDIVGFIRLASALRGGDKERKRVISDGQRELIAYSTPASVSKNRYGITAPIPFNEGENPLAKALGIKGRSVKAAKKTETEEKENDQ